MTVLPDVHHRQTTPLAFLTDSRNIGAGFSYGQLCLFFFYLKSLAYQQQVPGLAFGKYQAYAAELQS